MYLLNESSKREDGGAKQASMQTEAGMTIGNECDAIWNSNERNFGGTGNGSTRTHSIAVHHKEIVNEMGAQKWFHFR